MITSYWKFQEKCICIFHTQLFDKIPTGIHNSLNPRPELLVVTNDKLPVYVGHYLQDLGPEGGQGVMRLSFDLSLKFAPHRRIKRITILWAGRPDFLWPVVFSGWPSARLDDFSCVARKAFSTPSKSLVLCRHIF